MTRRNLCSVIALGFAAGASAPAYASHHEMQIEQVIGGVDGDTSVQAIQLRMRDDLECFVGDRRLIAHDAEGLNPVELIIFPSDVPGCDAGDRILVTSSNFSDFVDGTLVSDFELCNAIPESYLAAGSLTYEDDSFVLWRLSWGGDDYTGDTTGFFFEDLFNDLDGEFGPPWPGAMPSDGYQALQFQGEAADMSTTNEDDYALTTGTATFTNNAGDSFKLSDCPADLDNSETVGTSDLLDLLSQWGDNPGGPPDFNGDGTVATSDLLKLLGLWGPCPK